MLPCGEIDLLATVVVDNARIILVGEVKNNDQNLFKPGAFERLGALIKHAEQQLQRKGDWVQSHWKDVLQMLSPELAESETKQDLYIGRLVLTARPVAPHFFQRFTGCSVAGFRSLATDLQQQNPRHWESHWRVRLTPIS